MVKDIGEIPFLYSPITSKNNPSGIPNKVPFSLYEDEIGIVKQVRNQVTEDALDAAYRLGSAISGQMDDHGNGKEYADEFLSFIFRFADVRKKRVLDIGCGTGYLLSRLQERGAECIGVEPGRLNVEYGRDKFGVNMIHDFFSKDLFVQGERFDIIIFYGVLEHIFDTKSFIEDVISLLSNDGMVIVGVPNCLHHILRGDISMLLAEHWNYFTSQSVNNLLAKYGLLSISIETSTLGGTIFGVFKSEHLREIDYGSESINCFEVFCKEYDIKKQTITDYLKRTTTIGQNLGIYVAGRVINWLSVCMGSYDMGKIRFIDDNPLLEGTYYPGFDCSIESWDTFMRSPSDNVLVGTDTYEEAVMNRISKSGFKGNVVTIRELLS